MIVDRRTLLASGGASLAALALPARAAADPLAPLYALASRKAPPRTWRGVSEAAVKYGQTALMMEGAVWRGKPTKVLTLVGLPANAKGRVPGVVLAHGGGGTAYAEWVKRWTDVGFAAITCALEGQTDVRVEGARQRGESPWVGNPEGGPPRTGIYGDGDQPIGDQWMFHAQWAMIAAHTLLASMPGVDAKRIGICGISWGSIINATTMGIDARPMFAVPIYGGAFMSEMTTNQYRVANRFPSYDAVWKPELRLARARTPSLWITDLPEKHFSLIIQAKSYRTVAGPHMVAIKPDMTHNHPQGWSAQEAYAFARSIIDKGRPWAMQTAAGRKGAMVSASFRSDRPLTSGLLYTTLDRGHSADRKWTAAPAAVAAANGVTTVTGALPAGATAWFFNLDAGGLVLSSDLVTSGPQ